MPEPKGCLLSRALGLQGKQDYATHEIGLEVHLG